MDKQTDLILRLQDEADLCRNEGASDIAALLDEAIQRDDKVRAESPGGSYRPLGMDCDRAQWVRLREWIG